MKQKELRGPCTKYAVWLLALCVLMGSCAGRKPDVSLTQQEEPNASSISVPEETPVSDMADDSQTPDGTKSPDDALSEERADEIMCIFGANRKVRHNEQGQPVESDSLEYQTSVISFYYDENGVLSAEDIAPYGFFGWYLMYTSLQSEKIAKVLPDFERMVLVRNSPISGEIYGAPGDAYETIVTSFFDVDVQRLRGDDLYDEKAHAYVPIAGPGIGERPVVRVAGAEQQGDRIALDILVEGYSPMEFRLTVRENPDNEFAGIQFVSLLPKLE